MKKILFGVSACLAVALLTMAQVPVTITPASAVNGAGTMSSNLVFSPDATYDIGASGATRPRNFFLSGSAVIGGNVQAMGANGFLGTYTPVTLAVSTATPTISSGFGTGASITVSNGTADFIINVGTTSATTGVIGLPTATTGWTVRCEDITTFSTTVFLTRQTASTTATATIGGFTSAAVAQAWTNSDLIRCVAIGY